MPTPPTLAEILRGDQPFCVIHREERPTVTVLAGPIKRLSSLDEIPLRPARQEPGAIASLSLIPYSQAKEKGFVARESGEGLLCLTPVVQLEVPLEALRAVLPDQPIAMVDEPRMVPSEEEYARIVAAVVKDEIGNGEGANFNLARAVRGRIADYALPKALAIFRSLLASDYGTYWKFIVFTGAGGSTFVGSTPEKHLSVDKGRVVMNPISGTFRKDKPDATPVESKRALLSFLQDPKEVNELFMVVDEELKMMARICDKGGIIAGPFLKEMSRLIHTEYHLIGQSTRGLIDCLRESMFAATTVGSPLENAFRIIQKYEPEARRFYGAAMAVVGLDEDTEPFLDSPILIRTAEIEPDGAFTLRLGATIVHDSVPEGEVQETRAKGAAVLGSFTGPKPLTPKITEMFGRDPALLDTLHARNQRLSNFWLNRQEPELAERSFDGLRVTLIDHEDNFLHMFGHMLRFLGATVTHHGWRAYDPAQDRSDVTVLGPGPGNPNLTDDPKMQAATRALTALLAVRRPIFAVCLGHQIACRHLGYAVRPRPQATQGVQRLVSIFGRPERCGFYNTFYGHADPVKGAADPRLLSVDPDSGEIFAIHDPALPLVGFQFHPESILTQNGLELVRKGMALLVPSRRSP